MNLYAMQALNMRHRYGAKWSTPLCRNAGKIPSVPADLNGLKVHSANLIFDWLITHSVRFQYPLFVMRPRVPRLCLPCLLFESSVSFESGKWTLNNSFSVYFPVLVYWQSGSLMMLTLLVACFHDLHESGTAQYIIGHLAVPLPWGSSAFS
jgi:hypothetical protein